MVKKIIYIPDDVESFTLPENVFEDELECQLYEADNDYASVRNDKSLLLLDSKGKVLNSSDLKNATRIVCATKNAYKYLKVIAALTKVNVSAITPPVEGTDDKGYWFIDSTGAWESVYVMNTEISGLGDFFITATASAASEEDSSST